MNIQSPATEPWPPILVADDEETDRFIWQLACERAPLPHPLILAQDGQEAVDILATQPRPAMLVLDLKMPRMDGFDVLAWLAAREQFKGLPVFIFSSSSDENDIRKAKQMGAWEYFVKPHELGEWVKIIRTLPERSQIHHNHG
ncbi:MAG TPA: response regulator [Verrucomicrobiae bacterium]